MDDQPSSLVRELRRGCDEAEETVFNLWFEKLVRFACSRLRRQGLAPTVADEEDLALSALNTVIRRLQAGEFPQLVHREELGKLLYGITRRKATALWRRETAGKRDFRRAQAAVVAPAGPSQAGPPREIAEVTDRDPTADEVVVLLDLVEHLLGLLGETKLCQVARLHLEGYSNHEIAMRISRVEGTVERMLYRIREIWQDWWNEQDEARDG